MAQLKFRAAALLAARERAGLTPRQLATLAEQRTPHERESDPARAEAARKQRVRAWESRIWSWESGVDSPSAPYIPTLAQLLGVAPLELFEVDPAAPPFTALRLAAGLTLDALAKSTGISYTTLHRKLRGRSPLPADALERLAAALGTTPMEVLAAIDRDR